MFLKNSLDELKVECLQKIAKKDAIIENLEDKVKKSKLNRQDIISITDDLDKLKNSNLIIDFVNGIKIPSAIPTITVTQNWIHLTNGMEFLNTVNVNNKYIDSINRISTISNNVNITKYVLGVDKVNNATELTNKIKKRNF